MTSVGERIPNIISSRPIYDLTTEHVSRTDVFFYEILTKSNDFNQFRDLMMEFLANRPNVVESHDAHGTGRWNFRKLTEQDKEYVSKEQLRIWDLEEKEEIFYEKLDSIPYIDNIETVTKSFPPRFQRPPMYLNEDGTYTSETEYLAKYPLKKSVSKSPEELELFKGLTIHSQSKGGKKTRKIRKSRK
uniref:Uncharacterized protein n=1 Tax=viral metagenome TaxID=1070528 RepID=A0A6C0D2N8_9ZZZZ